jgi:HSP20 family molecular chaperone IbpA
MSVYADCKESFTTLARIASKSVADPPWFAAPIGAREDQDSVTVDFHVPGKKEGPLLVQANDESVTVRSGQKRDRPSPMRLCAMPCPVDADQVEATQMGDLLRVRMAKKRPPVDSREASPAT